MTPVAAQADWRITLGTHLPETVIVLLCAAAGFAVALSAASLFWERRRGRALLLLALRTLGLAACLVVALQPRLEVGQVAHVPNHVAVLVDGSRSMAVKPPDGGPSRAERAAALVTEAAPLFAELERKGHRVNLYTFGEALEATSAQGLRGPPRGEATRIGETLAELRGRYAGRDLGGVILLSDGIDTGRIGKGPIDGETRRVMAALGAPINTVAVAERELRDLSIAAVLADDFAFVRTPIKLEAVVRAHGLPNRQIEVTLERDGRLVDSQPLVLGEEDVEARVAFDWTPDRPGEFVFEIATPVLAGEALSTNNRQVFTVKVIRDRVRVLHVSGRPSWDQRFLRSLLRLDPNVDLVSFFILRTETDDQPRSEEMALIPFPHKEVFEEQLRSFDLLVFHNFNYGPYHVEPYLPGVRDYIQSGGAIAMIGGDLSFASGGYGTSALRDVLPVDLDGIPPIGERAFSKDVFRPKLTPEGLGHPVTALSLDPRGNEARFRTLPPLEGLNRVARVKPSATTLLAHPTQRSEAGGQAPVLAVMEAGKGRSLALLTDTAWHWGFLAAGAGDDGRAFQRFWENAIRWLVRDPALTPLRVELDKAEYRRKQPLVARVRTARPDFSPAAGVAVTLRLVAVERGPGAAPVAETAVTTSGEGEAYVELPGQEAGAYRLLAEATIGGRVVREERTFVVRPEGKELEDVLARDAVLRELAEASGGAFHEGSLGTPSLRPPRVVRVGNSSTRELWSHPLVLALAVALLAAEWALRRRAGHG